LPYLPKVCLNRLIADTDRKDGPDEVSAQVVRNSQSVLKFSIIDLQSDER
jgi:hypothetical protein